MIKYLYMIKKLAYIFIFLAYSIALFAETDFNIDDSIITKILNGKVYTLDNLAKNSITIIFDDNKISGKSTINTYSASYRIIGDNIEINDISASKMNGPQNLMKEEEEYLQLLSEAHNLEIKGNVLKIKTKADKELIFKEVVELSSNYLKGKEFVLKNAFDELNITIGFTKNYIYGYNNRDKYFSAYTINDDKILIKDIKTESNEETANKYINLLGSISKISLEGDELILTTKDKEKLIYKMKS